MFQEIDYLFLFPEKPTDISRDRLFIPFPKNQQMFQEREIIYSIPEKPADVSRERDYLFHSRKTS
jgi:hypothetical protein